MNLRLPLLLIATICVGVIFVCCPANASEERALRILNLDANTFSFDDLDVRDSSNRPITSFQSKQQLKQIFQAGIFELLTRADLYSFATALSILNKSLNLTLFNIARSLPQKTCEILCALLPVRKNWDKLLVLLSNLFMFAVSCSIFGVHSSCSTPAAKSSAPQVLRC